MLVQRRRDSRAALRLMRKLPKKQGFAPKLLVTDKLRSYAAAFRRLRLTCRHEQGLRRLRVSSAHGGQADASDRTRVQGAAGLPPDAAGRAVAEYLAVLDDAAFGAATEVTPKFIAPADPATRRTAGQRSLPIRPITWSIPTTRSLSMSKRPRRSVKPRCWRQSAWSSARGKASISIRPS